MSDESFIRQSIRLTGDPDTLNATLDPLHKELESQGFAVEMAVRDQGAQAAVAWALPPLIAMMVSGAGAVGALAAKKYFDGFLEELGVKALGSRSAQLLKGAFRAGLGSENGYYRLERQEPSFRSTEDEESNNGAGAVTATDGDDERGLTLYGMPSPLSICLNLGGEDADNPPWKITFIFARDLDNAFDEALSAIPDCLNTVRALRSDLWITLKTKLANPEKYYGRTLEKLSWSALLHEVIDIIKETCGVYLFDTSVHRWIRVSSSSGLTMVGELVQNLLEHARHPGN